MKQNLLFNRANAFGMRFIMVLTMLLVVGIGQAWGETAEFLPSHFSGQGTTSTGSAISATINGVTFKCDKGYGTTQIRCYSGSKITISSSNTITAISFTLESKYQGGLEASYTNLSTNSWEKDLSSQARITKCVVTYEEASADPYTVTLETGSGSVTDTELTETSAGAGVELPTPTLNGCDEWSFAGWKTTSAVTTETMTEPTLIPAGNYKPTANITLYAVYKRTEEGEGGGSTPTEVSKTYTFSDYEVGTQYAEETYELDDDVTINIKGCHINTQLRVYGAQSGIVISEELPGRTVSMGFNMGYKADKLVVSGSTDGTSWNKVGSISTTTSYKDYTLDFGETNYTYFKLNVEGSSQIRIAKMSITYESTSGGGSSSTTYYHSTPECITETVLSVTYNGNGNTSGSVPTDATEYKKDNQVIVLGNTGTLAKTGYTFSGWNTEADGTGTTYAAGDKFTITENTTLYAQWTAQTYTVTLNTNGGTINGESVSTYTYGVGATLPTNVIKTGYVFVGWYANSDLTGDKVTAISTTEMGDKEFWARWTPAQYQIIYKDQGDAIFSGAHEDGYPNTHTYNTPTTLKSATKNHYNFGGWYKESDCSGTAVTTLGATEYTENITLYAKWEPKTYIITLDANGGIFTKDGNTSAEISVPYVYGTYATYDAAQSISAYLEEEGLTISREGYQLNEKWQSQGAAWTKIYTATGDRRIQAQWTKVDCRWIETDIADITSEDEVVVTMKIINSNGEIAYQALGTETITNSPKSQGVKVTSGVINPADNSDFEFSKYSWSISTVTGGYTGYTLQPYGMSGTYLYGMPSYISIGNKTENNVFLIYASPENDNKCFAYVRDNAYYVGYGTEDGQGAWKRFTSYQSVLNNQTLKFYKRVCVDASNPWYTVTFDAGSGSCDTESLTGTKEDGIILPTANPPATCATDGWEFAGWWTESVAETTTSPGELLTEGSNYKPERDGITLYAVYSKTGEGGGTLEEVSNKYTFSNYAAGTQYAENEQHKLDENVTLITTQCHFTSELRIYSSNDHNGYVVSNKLPGRIVSIGINAGNKVDKVLVDGSADGSTWANVGSIAVTSTSYNDYTLDFRETNYTYFKLDVEGVNQVRLKSITITWESIGAGGGSTITYNSNPSCEVCDNIITISKGEETNGNTFTLSQSGDIETCDGEVEVVVTPTPTEHYSVTEVTATIPTTGGTPTTKNNEDGTWTVTYAQNSQGGSTINVTFVEDTKATITLSELGVTSTIDTYYVGEQYTLPTTSSQSCEGKELVGWSTEEVAETDTKPTEDYYERGAEVTLAATQTFYAVYATSGEGGGGEYTLVTSANDFTDGVYVIAALDNGTYYFIDGNGEYKGLGVEVNGLAASEVNNGSFSELSLPSGSVEIEFEDDGEPLDGNHYYFVSYYDETISNWKFLDDDRTNATLKWVEWDDGLAVYTYHPVFDTKTYLLSGSGAAISQNGSTKASFIRNYENGSTYNNLYFFKKSGSTNTYTAYTTSCVPTYTITYDFAGGTGSHCSNTTVPQGESYTICEDEPTKTGYTFLHWSDGTTTYAAGVTIKPTSDITLTAVWQINTYTVTWSNNGATDEVTYNHGESLVVPTDIASCDGVKEFVGWTTQSGYYHATEKPDDLFTTKTEVVTATATYYAVFATPGGTGSTNVTTTLDFSAQGYNNEQAISSLTVNGVIATLAKGTNADNGPKYYNSGTAVRRYGGNTITLSANNITAVTFTFGSGETADKNSNTISANTGSWEEPNWTGNAVNELVFTISGSSGHRRIQSIAVTHNIGSTAAHTDYTTICRQVESIEVTNPKTEFSVTDEFTIGTGKVMAYFEDDSSQDVTNLATFSGYNMNEVGTYTVTVTYMGATATYNIEVKPLDNAWVLTWNVSGKTNTGLRPRSVTKGSAIGTLPIPEVPAGCEGKTFIGWTESNIVPSDGIGITYITKETVPTTNTTYYAVFATVNNFSTQKPIEDIVDGAKVVIVAIASMDESGSTGKAISSHTISITSQGVIGLAGDAVSIYEETINTPHSTCIWTIVKQGEKVAFKQDSKYIRATDDINQETGKSYRKLLLSTTPDYWTLHEVDGKNKTYHMQSGNTSHYVEWFDHTDAKYDEGEKYIGFVPYTTANNYGDFDMQFFVVAGDGGDKTDFTTGCEEYTITYYGFRGGYSTSTSSDGTIVLPVNSMHTVPNCGDVVKDHTNLGREFLNVWMTQPHGGHTFKPGDTFILTQDTTLYAQWKLETTTDVTLPTGVEDLKGTDVYVYGGNTLTMVPDVVTINSLILKGGLQSDGSYKMPNVWIPEGATLVRNSNKIYLDLAINAKNWYPFAVPFETKNDQYLDYLDPVLREASIYGTHFAIKTYDGQKRAEVGEDRANNWVHFKRHQTNDPHILQPGVGYIISALTKSGKDTATIRIPMTVPNKWLENGEQTTIGSTSRNTVPVTAYTGSAATEHHRHAGWNFIANPYLSEFAGNNVNNGGNYINGWINIANQYNYEDTDIPYVTIPAYDFAYYEQKKVSEATLSPEWSFFVQIAESGTINFVKEGRQAAPAGIAARTQEERPVKMDIDIILTDGSNSDQMGIIVCERYSDAYEIGRDLEKMFGSAYNLVVYSLMNDNTPLAYQAVPVLNDTQTIPIGYRAPEQGEYTFSLNQNTSSIDLLNEMYEQLVLVDYETGALTNLLNSDYTFNSERTQSNSRFALYAVLRQNAPTDLPNISDNEDTIRKIFYNGHLFIIRNGNVYNGNGQFVK